MVATTTAVAGAEPGVVDLRHHDFAEEGIAELSGAWHIYWRRLLEPHETGTELATPDGTFAMPGTWNTWEFQGERVGGDGFATFVVDVLLPPDLERVGLRVPNASTAYRLWADGVLVASSGSPGPDRETSRPHYVMRTAVVDSPGEEVRLVLQVSNFHHRRGGMWKPIELGTAEQIATVETHENVYDLLLLGSFIALGLFNVFLYATFRTRSPQPARGLSAPLLLAVVFFAMVIRVFVTGQIFATRLIPQFPWSLQLRLEYLSAHVVFVAFAWVSDRTYPGAIPRWVVWGITVFVAVNAMLVVAFPVIVYSRVVTSYNVVKSIVLLAMTTRYVVWAIRGHREAWTMVSAILIFFLITFGETLHYREVILSRDFAPVGFLVSLLGPRADNETLVYLVSTIATLGLILVVFNLFVFRVSLSFLRVEQRLTPIAVDALGVEYGVSPRELQIIELVALGRSNKEIGAELHISEGTVKNHLYRIMRKLGVGNRTEIAVRLKRTG